MDKYIYTYARPLNFSTISHPYIISFTDENISKEKRKIISINDITDVYTIYGLPINKKAYSNYYKAYPFYNYNINELICPFYSSPLPKEGSFTGYKIIYYKGNEEKKGSLALCTLLIENASYCDLRAIKTSAGFFQCCTDKAKVLNIVTLDNQTPVNFGVSYYSPFKIVYKVGETIEDTTGDGIYFFMTPQEAVCYSIYGY